MSIDLGKYPVAASTSKPRKSKTASQTSIGDILNRDIKLFGGKLGDRKKERFYSELSTLLKAGIDIRTSLELIEVEQEKKADRALFGGLRQNVVEGCGLSEALGKAGAFGTYEQYSVRIGEESGQLNTVLEQLADYFERKIKLRRQFVGALSYPIFVFMVSMGVVWFMLRFIVPMFADVLSRTGKELPALTQFIMDLSEKTAANFPLFLLSVVALGGCLFFFRKRPRFRSISTKLMLRIPIIGPIIHRVYLGRFCQAMHLLMASRTPLTESVDLVQQMIGLYPIEHALSEVKADLVKGQSLRNSLSRFKIFPRRMVSLIGVAEEVNQLDVMFGKMSEQYGQEVEHRTSLLGSLLEPIMIIFIAAVVGVILISMYMPLFDMNARM